MIAISNPVSASAIFLSLTEELLVKERIKIGALCAIYVMVVLIFVVWFGKGILSILGISIDSFQVAGAVIIHAHDFSSSGIFKSKLVLSGLVLLVAFVIGVTMWLSALFSKFISNSGVNIITRIMGLILTAIGFNILGTGLLRMFPGLG